MSNKIKILTSDDGSEQDAWFPCPGCKTDHPVRVKSNTVSPWGWNGSLDFPTFTPSLLVWGDRPDKRCHSFIRDGCIIFLDDCWHELKGQTVEMEEVEEAT